MSRDNAMQMVDRVEYAEAAPGKHWHEITVEPTSRLAGWIGDGAPLINSFHHQAVGLQWHNEFMWRRDGRWLGPFRDLVAAASDRALARTRLRD